MEYKEIAAKVNDFMIKRTEAFICSYYNDVKYELLRYMEIVSGQKVYSMKIEYLIQYLLQEFCRENREKNSKEYCYFENQANNDRVLQVSVNPDLYKEKGLVQVLENLQAKFNQWIACLVLLYNLEFSKSKNMFPNICRGISDIIQKLIEPDAIQLPTTGDRVKVSPKPRYPVPTETLYVRTCYILGNDNLIANIWSLFHTKFEHAGKTEIRSINLLLAVINIFEGKAMGYKGIS